MKLYRVITENKNYQDILQYLDNHFPDGYTIISTNGAWQGQREKSLIIEVLRTTPGADLDIGHFAYWLKKHNKQEAILVETINVDVQYL